MAEHPSGLVSEAGTGANATALNDAVRTSYPQDLQEVQLKRENPAYSPGGDKELDKALVAKTLGIKAEQVGDARVRGGHVSYSVDAEDGRNIKGAFPLDDLGKSTKGNMSQRPVDSKPSSSE